MINRCDWNCQKLFCIALSNKKYWKVPKSIESWKVLKGTKKCWKVKLSKAILHYSKVPKSNEKYQRLLKSLVNPQIPGPSFPQKHLENVIFAMLHWDLEKCTFAIFSVFLWYLENVIFANCSKSMHFTTVTEKAEVTEKPGECHICQKMANMTFSRFHKKTAQQVP